MSSDIWLEETYFDWLGRDAFKTLNSRREYEGVLRELHKIPFYWTIWSDENRAGDALAFRQSDFLGFQSDLDHLDQKWLAAWAAAAPSVLEVLLGMCRRWSFYFEREVPFYFGHLFRNLGLERYPGRVLSSSTMDTVRGIADTWMSRQFSPNGLGSPFPIVYELNVIDMRKLDIWSQMNAYSAEHFQ